MKPEIVIYVCSILERIYKKLKASIIINHLADPRVESLGLSPLAICRV